MKKTIHLHLHIPTVLFCIVMVVLYNLSLHFVFGQSTGSNLIHACVRNTNGTIRIVNEDDTCDKGETLNTWPATAGFGTFLDLQRADLTRMDLRFRYFKGINLTGANLSDAQLDYSNFSGADFSNAKVGGLNHTNITGATFKGAKFVSWGPDYMDFTVADITGADFSGTQFMHSNFSNKNFESNNLNFVAFDRESNLSKTIFPPRSITSLKVRDSNLTDAKLEGVTLDDSSDFDGSNLTRTNFRNAQFVATFFWRVTGTDTDFTNATLNTVNFGNAKLVRPNFTNANLIYARELSTATLTDAVWSNTTCPDGTNSDDNGNTCEGHY